MAEVQVENIVFSFSLSCSLDLAKLAEILPDVQYNPEDVPTIVLQFPHPRSMATLSSDGTVVVTGPKSIDEAQDVVKMILDRLNVVGVEVQEPPEMSVRNVTVSTNLHQKLKLRTLAKTFHIEDFDEKEFPGLVYKGEDPNTVILLFDTGKIVCNGNKLEDVTSAIEKILEKLLSFGIEKEENVCQK